GDGSADDTAAIQAAIDRADGLLELPGGTYRITRTLVIDLAKTGPMSVSGGLGAGRLIMAGAGPALRVTGTHRGTAGPDTFAAGVYARERMPQIDGLGITGAHPDAEGIEVSGTMQMVVRAVVIHEVRDAIRLTGTNRNVIIDAVHLY